MAEEFGRHRAKEFNVGVERKDTGVRYQDVAGIDSVKADIEEVMKMILGSEDYKAMGARAPRVSLALRPELLGHANPSTLECPSAAEAHSSRVYLCPLFPL